MLAVPEDDSGGVLALDTSGRLEMIQIDSNKYISHIINNMGNKTLAASIARRCKFGTKDTDDECSNNLIMEK